MQAYRKGTTQAAPVRTSEGSANPIGVIGLDALLTLIVLLVLLEIGLPLAASLGAAWIGGAVATVATLAMAAGLEDGCRPQVGSTALLP
ncbi:hypothetical protein DKT77_17290 [Meridianimarinicoccus roseus]|uniref:Uncharacterized protein n=1 Tax=Meridianimarinicoccus roseus TaxID=2072018 RepID=A0A2V2L798_9RHOB|nr:hypothetical protein [Meridianimarinicoccus roseus]PWR01318.1 hypothetical protein DKT77_17290 [Meridianimarinicoccus roseus]